MDSDVAGTPMRHPDHVMEMLGRQTVRISELEADNASLRAQLNAARHNGVKAESRNSPSRVDQPAEKIVPPGHGQDGYQTLRNQHDVLTLKYDELAKSYRELQETNTKWKTFVERSERRYQEAKENARQWKIYIEKIKAKDNSHEPADAVDRLSHRQEPNLDTDSTPRPSRTTNISILPDDIIYKTNNALESAAVPLRKAELAADIDIEPLTEPLNSSRTHTASSQTTEVGSEPLSNHSHGRGEQSSDSEPVVVSARSLKRKRSPLTLVMAPPTAVKREPNSPGTPIEIRSDDYSSPKRQRQGVTRRETSDLDALAGALLTPRKHRRLGVDQRAVSEELIRLPALPSRMSSLSDTDIVQADQRKPSDAFGGNRGGRRSLKQEHLRTPTTGGVSLQASLVPDEALRPRSVNVPPKVRRNIAKADSRHDATAAKIAVLSEDGDTETLPKHQQLPATKHNEDTPKSVVNRRLGVMLEGATPDRACLARSPAPGSAGLRNHRPLTPASHDRLQAKESSAEKEHQLSAKKRPSAQGKVSSPNKCTEPRFKRPYGLEPSPPPVQPEEEPLRLRPLTSLRLEDFKINPKYLGTGFAFADTFRGREQRRCLQGCNDPKCCGGAIRKAVEMAGNQKSDKSDAEVLEAYLGPEWSQIMGAYTHEKRENLLMEARVSSFANQYGKHRHAFERRSTPPGFWRTDMPSTQEAAEDRAKAHEMERKKVEERWREAMRPGGRWLFRDE